MKRKMMVMWGTVDAKKMKEEMERGDEPWQEVVAVLVAVVF